LTLSDCNNQVSFYFILKALRKFPVKCKIVIGQSQGITLFQMNEKRLTGPPAIR
jgi:hypothetical protein